MNLSQPYMSQAYAAALASGFDPNALPPATFSSAAPQQQQQFGFTFPQFSAGGAAGASASNNNSGSPPPPMMHPQQQHLHQLNMQQAALMMAQQAHHQQQFQQDLSSASSGKKVQSKADRRAEHNAIERARRESLNSKFQQLAHALPNLQNDRRPSKGTIIERTLEFVKDRLHKEERYRHQIRQLRLENRRLRKELKRESRREYVDVESDDQLSYNSSCSSLLYMSSSSAAATPTPTKIENAPPSVTGYGQPHLVPPAQHPPEMYGLPIDTVMYHQQQQQQQRIVSGSPLGMYESDDDNSSNGGGDDEQQHFQQFHCSPVSPAVAAPSNFVMNTNNAKVIPADCYKLEQTPAAPH
ncbi:hypothetical protein VTP01DRAFT_8216 [Rhizomucor pusillus]|uniref:uncharacterized protein n=1 Tax=Rhizomucor pusillus TaxID=4840 RepID=UPI0037437869